MVVRPEPGCQNSLPWAAGDESCHCLWDAPVNKCAGLISLNFVLGLAN